MKKLFTALAFASMALCTASHAQPADPKLTWATRVVALQQGPELQRLVSQLADNATQEVVQNWAPKLDTVPAARKQKASDDLNAELKKYFDDVSTTIGGKVAKVSADDLVPAYMERFSLDELKQIAAFFESPAIKKYQAVSPELGSLFVKQLVESTRVDVMARVRLFDDRAGKIIAGPSTPAAAPDKSTPAPKK